MTIERYTATIPASGVVQVPPGNFFLLTAASSAVNVRLQRDGTSEGTNGVIGGLYLRRIKPWEFIEIFGTAGATLEWWAGSELVDRDETDIRLAVSVIAGSVGVVENPATAITNTTPVDAASGAETLLIAANSSRKRVRIQCDTTNADGGTTGTHCVLRRSTGGAAIAELVPGMFYEFKNTTAFYVRNDTGSTCRFYIAEET